MTTTVTHTANHLDAWGGAVRPGHPCWIIDHTNYTITPVAAAVLIDVDYEERLLYCNRFYRACDVAASEEAARKRLHDHARETLAECSLRIDKARDYLFDNHAA